MAIMKAHVLTKTWNFGEVAGLVLLATLAFADGSRVGFSAHRFRYFRPGMF